MSSSQAQTWTRPPKTLYVSPYEYHILGSAIEIAHYIKKRIIDKERVSDYHISRFVPELEAFITKRKFKAETSAEVIRVFSRHFGFENDEEKQRVNEAVINLLDRLEYMRNKDPVKAHELVKGIRTLVIEIARGRLTVAVKPREQEETERERGE